MGETGGRASTKSGSQDAAADDVGGAVAPNRQGSVTPQLVRVAPLEAGLHPPSLPLHPPALPLHPPTAGDPEPAPPFPRSPCGSSRRVRPTAPQAGPPRGGGATEGPQAVAVRRPDVHETHGDRPLQVAPPRAPPPPMLLLSLCPLSRPQHVAFPLPPGGGPAALRLVDLLGGAGGPVSEGGRLRRLAGVGAWPVHWGAQIAAPSPLLPGR